MIGSYGVTQAYALPGTAAFPIFPTHGIMYSTPYNNISESIPQTPSITKSMQAIHHIDRQIYLRGCSCSSCSSRSASSSTSITDSTQSVPSSSLSVHSDETVVSPSDRSSRIQTASVVAVCTESLAEAKRYSCPICSKSFCQSSNLSTHMRIHTGEKPFKCQLCSSTFSQSSNMTRHMRVHTGEKPFECPICQKTCSRKGSLDMHMRIHTGEKPYQCHVCQKRFSIKSSLTIHLRIHTGERPFKCTLCDKRFPRRSEVKRHMKYHNRMAKRASEMAASASSSTVNE